MLVNGREGGREKGGKREAECLRGIFEMLNVPVRHAPELDILSVHLVPPAAFLALPFLRP